MLDINFLKNSKFFNQRTLKKNEVLFDEGDIDNNIYILLAGELSVEKYTTRKKTETKVLGHLIKNDIFGEGALNSNQTKGLKLIAKRETHLLYINAQEGLEEFSKSQPKEGLDLLKYIIYISNKRLLEANLLITANYQISHDILSLNQINNKSIFELIDRIKDIINVDYILFLEKNTVMENYLIMKYDSRKQGKMQSEIIEITDNKLELLELKLTDTNYYIQELAIGEDGLGYLVYFRKKKDFDENDKKILTSISSGISGVIKEKKLIEEERDKNFMEK
ncbi:cyclic nucleotide-binding domain-containing protein [Candidatus Gracilibacteria bacterium 28_42_T64]|nr:cyclic nucleotide-binding domain-containing protein [Candidatus Gracilibacteria bacterium 28_42_T64]